MINRATLTVLSMFTGGLILGTALYVALEFIEVLVATAHPINPPPEEVAEDLGQLSIWELVE